MATTICAASAPSPPPRTSATTPAAPSRASLAPPAGLDSIAVVATERLTGDPPDPGGFRDGKAWIDYRGPPGTIPTVSFSDVVDGRVPDA